MRDDAVHEPPLHCIRGHKVAGRAHPRARRTPTGLGEQDRQAPARLNPDAGVRVGKSSPVRKRMRKSQLSASSIRP